MKPSDRETPLIFEKATVYCHLLYPVSGYMRSLLGYRLFEVNGVEVRLNGDSAPTVSMRLPQMRKDRSFEDETRSIVILSGWGHRHLPSEFDERGAGRHFWGDVAWNTEFDEFLANYLALTNAKVLLDLRRRKTLEAKPIAVPELLPIFPIPQVERAILSEEEISVREGEPIVRIHRERERDKTIVAAKRKQILNKTGKLECEVCGFDFIEIYGIDFCEVHHLCPLGESESAVVTRLEDLAIVCSNCHRAIHRGNPFFEISDLRARIEERRQSRL